MPRADVGGVRVGEGAAPRVARRGRGARHRRRGGRLRGRAGVAAPSGGARRHGVKRHDERPAPTGAPPSPMNRMQRIALATLLALTLAGCAAQRAAPEFLAAPSGPERPFSPAVRANGFLFLAGQIGTDSTGRLVPGGIQTETRQAMENIRAVLARSGSSFDRVVK